MAKVVKETFVACQEYVLPKFAENFSEKVNSTFINMTTFKAAQAKCAESGEHIKNAGQIMLAQYDYTPAREKFLIKTAQEYIELQLVDSTQSHTTSPAFLSDLANMIARMLSFYAVRKYKAPDSEKAQRKLCLAVQEELFKELFTDNTYIKNLISKQKAKQDLRQQPKSVQKRHKQAERQAKATAAYKTSCQVHGVFVIAQTTPRKGR